MATLTGTQSPARRGTFAALAVHSAYFTMRSVRLLLRQPFYLVITLVQPLVWLLLFGQLFKRIVELPGFGASNYADFLVPGIVIMTVLFSSGWSGMTFIEEIDNGIMDRLLTTPVRRGAIIIGSLAYQSISMIAQILIIFGVGRLIGAEYPGGLAGIGVSLVAGILLAAAFASMSNAYGLLLRSRESLIGLTTFLMLPLSFLSSAIMSSATAPEWIQHVSAYNPVDWAVVASREALSAHPDWGTVGADLGGLAVVAVVFGFLATRAFGAYQRSI
jgi:ABC-2 type transport system permease protein